MNAAQDAGQVGTDQHRHIVDLLNHSSFAHWDAAITRLSRLAAADAFVLAPAAVRNLPEGHRISEDLARSRKRLHRELGLLYGRVHGDMRAASVSARWIQGRAQFAARAYLAKRSSLVMQLIDQLEHGEHQALATRWEAAADGAPTRPHPWLAGRPTLSRIRFHWTRWWDQARDALDSRSTGPLAVPAPPR